MTKRIAILAALVAVALTLAGCGFKPPAQWNETEERERVAEALGSWVTGVEDYDVDAMAGNGILAPDFKLIIQEGSAKPYEKPAAKLMEELLGDEDNQLTFRKSKVKGGVGYQLEFDVDWLITRINKSSATVNGEFGVWETIEGGLQGLNFTGGRIENGWWNSDNGLITIDLVRTPNAWKMISMKIVFETGVGAGAASAARALSGTVGLGIGKLPSML